MPADANKAYAVKSATIGGVDVPAVTHGRHTVETQTKWDNVAKITLVTRQDVRVEIYANEGLFACRSFAHPAPAIVGVTHGRVTLTTTSTRDNVTHNSRMTDFDVAVEVFGNDPAALEALIGAAAANGVFVCLGASGDLTKTLKSVRFDSMIGPADLPEIDAGGKLPAAGVRGRCNFAKLTDTIATVWANCPQLAAILDSGDPVDVVFTVFRDDGSTGTITYADVQFTEALGSMDMPEDDSGGKVPEMGIAGMCQGTAALAVKIVRA